MTDILSFGGCGVEGGDRDIDPEHQRKIAKHSCFSKEASHRYGRIHLPVAPECNVQCNFCLREFDCVNESRPGVTSQVLTPAEAMDRVREVMNEFDNIRTIGIAGPGEPLANAETFETFRLIRENYGELHLCVSSNGLLLPDMVGQLDGLGVGTVTVTMNAVDPRIGRQIYAWVFYEGQYFRDIQGAELLLSKQLEGIRLAVDLGMLVKVNSVMIPTVNDRHLAEIARRAQELGAFMQNIMPLIPQYKFAELKQPTAEQRKKAQDEASNYIRQMRHCRQCRADAVGLLGQDLSRELCFAEKAEGVVEGGYRVAVTGSSSDGAVDRHFGQAEKFLIYEVKGEVARLMEMRDLPAADKEERLAEAVRIIADCRYVITSQAGPHARRVLEKAGKEVIEDHSPVAVALNRLVKYFAK